MTNLTYSHPSKELTYFVQQGWQCPICKRIYSPVKMMCDYCVPKKQDNG